MHWRKIIENNLNLKNILHVRKKRHFEMTFKMILLRGKKAFKLWGHDRDGKTPPELRQIPPELRQTTV